MPHTYPSPQPPSSSRASKSRGPQILGSGQSSIFLTPIQEARINSWRDGASIASPPPPPPKPKVVKSAPASINLSNGSSSCTCTCTCTVCAASPTRGTNVGSGTMMTATMTDCPTCGLASGVAGENMTDASDKSKRSTGDHPLPQKQKVAHGDKLPVEAYVKRPNAHVKGYYSSTRKQSGSGTNTTAMLPTMQTVRPKTPPSGLMKPVSGSGSGSKSGMKMAALRAPEGWADVDKHGLPTSDQMRKYNAGSPPPIQWGPAPGQDVPVREMAKPNPEKVPPRIAGARDPVSQNYYRQMFPPQGLAFPVLAPGMHPGMVGGQPQRWAT